MTYGAGFSAYKSNGCAPSILYFKKNLINIRLLHKINFSTFLIYLYYLFLPKIIDKQQFYLIILKLFKPWKVKKLVFEIIGF